MRLAEKRLARHTPHHFEIRLDLVMAKKKRQKKKVPRKKQAKHLKLDKSVLIFALVWMIILCGAGAFLTFYYYPTRLKEQNRVAKLPVMDVVRFSNLEVGGETVIVGRLIGNETVKIDEEEAFVAYHAYLWDVEVENNNTAEGEWEEEEWHWPTLNVAVGDGVIKALGEIKPETTAWRRGYRHEYIIEKKKAPKAKYGLRDLGRGSIMIRGARNEDPVAMAGKKAGDGVIQPQYLYFGSRGELLDSVVSSAYGFKLAGILMMIFGAVSGGVIMYYGRSEKK